MAEVVHDGKFSRVEVAGSLTYKREVINVTDTSIVLKTNQSGALINLAPSDTGVSVGLPTIKAADIGTYYDFIVTVDTSTNTATVTTGGHASDDTSRTAAYDDFIGGLNQLSSAALTAAGSSEAAVFRVPMADGDGTLVFDENLANNTAQIGTHFRATAIIASDIGTASANVWFIEGTLVVDDIDATAVAVATA